MRPALARLALGLLVALAAGGATACGAQPRVVRVYDGRIVEGRFVPSDAYAAFLRGALAEEAGDLRGALANYADAAGEDDDDAEIMTRIGEIRCKLDPRDPEADAAFTRASKLDPSYASTLAATARCALLRGNDDLAAQLAQRATAADPKNVTLRALAIRVEARHADPASRARAVTLTEAHGENAAAWDALLAWGRAHRDAELVARGLEGLVRAAPTRSIEVEEGAVALLQGGALPLARRVAAAVASAPRDLGVVGPRVPVVARLAVDEALARGDKETALARAVRGHVSLAEVAARAFLLDRKDIAAAVAATVSAADPDASGAQMVKAVLNGAPTAAAARQRVVASAKVQPAPMANVRDQPPEICALLLAERLATTARPEAARVWLAKITRTAMAPRDPIAEPLAVELVARGVLPVDSLSVELRASLPRAHASE